MKNDFSFVNVTGAKSLTVLQSFLAFYITSSKTKIISQLKVDSIIGSHKFQKRSNVSFEELRQRLSSKELSVRDNSKFPGLTIRGFNSYKGSCCVYFRSGVVNFIGYKKTEEIVRMLKLIETCLYK